MGATLPGHLYHPHRLAITFLIFICILLLSVTISQAKTHGKIAGERLLAATLNNDASRVAGLLEAGVDPDFYDKNRNTALIYAARDGRTRIAAMLIEAGASPDWIDGEKVTPLILASYKNHIEIVKLLLAAKVSRSPRDKWGRTALVYAKRRGAGDPVYLLLKQ
jgi:uncharacterized protein